MFVGSCNDYSLPPVIHKHFASDVSQCCGLYQLCGMDIWTAAAVLSILTRMCYSGDLMCSRVLHVIPTFMLIVWILYTLVEFSLVTCCHWVFRCCDVCCCTRLLLQQWSLSAAVDARNPLEFSPSLAECTAAAVLISENSSDLIVL